MGGVHDREESGFELFITVDGKLIDSHSEGLCEVGIVLVNHLEIGVEDESSIDFFLRLEWSSKYTFPSVELISGVLRMVDVDEKESRTC